MAGEAISYRKKKRAPGGTQMRLKFKQDLVDLCEKMKDSQIEKIAGVFSNQTGLRFTKIYEYFDELRQSGLIRMDGDKVIVV